MRSAGSVAPKRASLPEVTLARGAEPALFLAVAASVAFAGRESAGYDPESWAPLGLVLVALSGGMLLAGRRPPRSVVFGSGALAALAVWSGISPSWGGVPNQAWTVLDQSVLAAAALVAGSQLGSSARRQALLVLAALVGLVAQALEILIRLGAEPSPAGWFSRGLQGPVGYTNGQAAVLTMGIPLALWLVGNRRRALRAAGGASCGLLLGALLLTQSRGALIAAIAAVVVQGAWSRRGRLLLFLVPLAGAAVGLGFGLRAVDEAVVLGRAADQLDTLREYGLWTAAAALGLAAIAAAPAPAASRRRPLALTAAVVVAAILAGVGLAERSAISDAVSAVTHTPQDQTEFSAAGETRLLNVGFGGRRDTWRIAADMFTDEPLTGEGPGEFARRWTVERRLTNLYVLQPHSIEMELLSELGIVGFALFVLFVAAVVAGTLRVRDRLLGAAALSLLVLLVVHASVDLMWSLAGVVATTLFIVGAVIGSPRRFRPALAKRALVVAGAAALLISFLAPYLAERQLARAQNLERSDPAQAEQDAEAATKLNPWDAEALSLQGRAAEALGQFERAADRYHSAAANSRIPWLESFREARALSRVGRAKASRAACRRALRANPGEELLLEKPCGADPAVNAWPVVRVDAAGPQPAGARYDAFFRDDGCTQCSLAFVGPELAATIAGGSDAFDTAYALEDFGGPSGWPARIYTRDVIRLEEGQKLAGNLPILQVRDVGDKLVYEIYVDGETRTIRLWSPPGGLRSGSINEDSGVTAPSDGISTRTVEVSALADESVVVRVDGKALITRNDLSGSETGATRFLRVGITAYTETSPDGVRVYQSSVGVRRTRWFGPPRASE